MSTPQSTIHICSGIKWTNDYIHTPHFWTLTEQNDFFVRKVVKTFTDYTYLRRNWTLKVAGTMSEAQSWNYLYFHNYGERTYYYFITEVKYISENTVELVLDMDVMQTYAFEYVLHKSFIDREHSSSDEIGEHTLDEGLELGELENVNVTEIEELKTLTTMMLSTVGLETMDVLPDVWGTFIEGVYSGLGVYSVPSNNVNLLLNQLDEAGKTDGIVSMWAYPEQLVDTYELDDPADMVKRVKGVKSFEHHINIPTAFKDYSPRNKKLLTYPYRYLYVSNNLGNNAVYKYERFGHDGVFFDVMGSPFPDGGVKLMPRNYNGIPYNHEESLTLTGFPTCAWDSDAYKIWLAQNQNQNNMKMVSTGGQILGGAVTALAGLATGNLVMAGGGAMTAVHGATSIGSHLARMQDMDVQPPQARGSQSASVNACNSQMTFSFYNKAITRERARILDEYFTMYGYKCNRVKLPNKCVREHFTYTKTIGCHVSGAICNEDLRKIQSIYDNGITFWVDPDEIGNYSLSNNPL